MERRADFELDRRRRAAFPGKLDRLIAFLLPLLTALAGMWLLRWLFPSLGGRLPLLEQLACGLGLGMMAVAALGLAMNGGIILALRRASHGDVNIRGAFIHMLGDALGSIAIIAGALAIRYTGWWQVDPILSILIAILIVWTAWDIIRESLNILLEGLPRGLRLGDVTNAMRATAGVLDVHDLHIWSLGSSAHALSCHVLIEDVPPSASDVILRRLNGVLEEKFHIAHTTVQFEHVSCAISETGCAIPVKLEDHEGHHHHHHHNP